MLLLHDIDASTVYAYQPVWHQSGTSNDATGSRRGDEVFRFDRQTDIVATDKRHASYYVSPVGMY